MSHRIGKDGETAIATVISWYSLLICALVQSLPASASEPAGDQAEIYLKIHLSADRSDDGQSKAFSVSDNSSRFGLRGKHVLAPGTSVVWLMENKEYLDESGGRLANPAYAGVETDFGRLTAGFIDTPYKSFISKFNVMDDTIADVRSILGYTAQGADAAATMNVRARNAILLEWHAHAFSTGLLYSADKDGGGTITGADDNTQAGFSLKLEYVTGGVNLGVAAERWRDGIEMRGYRAGGRIDTGSYSAGMVWETIDSAPDAAYRRNAVAADVALSLTEGDNLKLQYVAAGASKGVRNSGATMLSLGGYHRLDQATSLYLILSRLANNANAKYRLGTSGHGDIIAPAYGENVWSLSLGGTFRLAKLL